MIASRSGSDSVRQWTVSRMMSGGSAGLMMMIALPRLAPPTRSSAARRGARELVDVLARPGPDRLRSDGGDDLRILDRLHAGHRGDHRDRRLPAARHHVDVADSLAHAGCGDSPAARSRARSRRESGRSRRRRRAPGARRSPRARTPKSRRRRSPRRRERSRRSRRRVLRAWFSSRAPPRAPGPSEAGSMPTIHSGSTNSLSRSL